MKRNELKQIIREVIEEDLTSGQQYSVNPSMYINGKLYTDHVSLPSRYNRTFYKGDGKKGLPKDNAIEYAKKLFKVLNEKIKNPDSGTQQWLKKLKSIGVVVVDDTQPFKPIFRIDPPEK